MPFREWDFSSRELFFELRELLREYPGTLPELREWPFRSESVFPEIGVVPRLLNHSFQNHYMHEISIFELFRGLQLRFSGVLRISLHYSYSVLVRLTRIQLQEIIPLSDFQSFFAIAVP